MRRPFVLAAAVIAALPALVQGQASIEGAWYGTLTVATARLRLGLNVAATNGSLSATLDSLDQSVKNIPVDQITVQDGAVAFEIKAFGGTFKGTMTADGSEIAGEWTQAGQSAPLVWKRTQERAKRPQEPVKPYPYREEEVAYDNPAATGVKLAATLTLPSGQGPFPVVLLISGSGPQDRDETIFEHRPFLVLADHLTRQGIAVLRTDDRGIGKSTGNFGTGTTEDFTSDAAAGVAYLKARPEIDPKRMGLAGHSEGGLVASMLAARSADVAFIVLLAGPGVNGEQLLYMQGAAAVRASGGDAKALADQRAVQEATMKVIKEETDDTAARQKLRAVLMSLMAGAPEKEARLAAGRQAAAAANPWFRFFITYDPATALRKVQCPVLALGGELDFQVPPKENLAGIAAALKEGGNKDYDTRVLAGHNHLLQRAKTGLLAEYGSIEETMSPQALQAISDWIAVRTKAR